MTIHSLGSDGLGGQKIQNVSLIGSDDKVCWELQPDGLHLQLPQQSGSRYACALRVALETK